MCATRVTIARRAFLAMAVAVALPAASAHAFHPPPSFEKPADQGGANGRYYTGSPIEKGYTCAACHVGGAGDITLTFESEPADLMSGSYAPEQWYLVTGRMLGEHLGDGAGANENTFLGEVVDDGGAAIAERWEADPDRFILLDGGRVLATRAKSGTTEWSFWFQAPPAGTGPITFYASGVDGNGRGASEPGTDISNDDTASFTLRICEANAPCVPPPPTPPLPDSTASCGAAPGGAGALAPLLIGFAILLTTVRRHRLARDSRVRAASAEAAGKRREDRSPWIGIFGTRH